MNIFSTHHRYSIKLGFVTMTCAITFLLLHPLKSFAQETPTPLQLTAIPARLGDADYSLKGKPGEIVTATVQVKNTSTTPKQVRTIVEDFVIGEDGTQPIPVDSENENRWNLANWITLSAETQALEPSKVGVVQLTITVPTDAIPGGRYAMIMHSPLVTTDPASNSGTGISQRVGTLIYFLVEGEIHEEAYLKNIQSESFFEFGPVPFSFEIENRSDLHLHPNIQVEITNMLGKSSDHFVIESKNVFPGEQRAFEAAWNRKWGLGRYNALITTTYGQKGNVVTGEFTFWIIPLRVILVILFIIALVLSTMVAMQRKLHSSLEDKVEEEKQLKAKLRKTPSSEFDHFKDEHN